ncbi:MAG TPA: NAD(P)-binding domain-containing protein, partial [Polyangiaceae bacterium]|nr:NAD(P)-binding domain-containing protein [Polyangiaceae bacterium]
MTYSDVAIIGAGPYGLSVSAQLSYRGIEHRIFGPPMQTWRSMPKGMCLKSLDFATNIYSPKKGYSLIEYCESHGLSHAEPLSGELVSNYGCWAQEQLVPHLEPAEVTRLAPTSRGFEISLPSGEKLEARRVVMATGLAYFANLPSKLRGLPRELVSHTSDHRDYDRFRDKDVWVLGSGQSAIEAAVMLYEIGARPTVLTRGAPVSFAGPPVPKRILRHRIMYPMSVLGPSRIGFFLQHVPMGFYHLPDAKRIALTRKLYGPWGAWWIAKRFEGKVPGISHTEILSATPRGDKLELKLASRHGGAEREVLIDHLVCGTGYEPDLDVIPFLDKNLASGVRRIERSPKLSPHFESSTPGLYFVGASAAFSFGPLLRFVAGAEFAAPTVAKHLASSA